MKNISRPFSPSWFALALVLVVCPLAARATTIVYTFTGLVSGSYNSGSFSSKAYSMSFTGDTANVITSGAVNIIGYSSYFGATGPALTVSLSIADVGDFAVTTASMYVFSSGTFAGFGRGGSDVLGASISPTYDLRSGRTATNFGSGNGLFYGGTFSVTGGPAATISLGNYTGTTFGASTAAVPEPATSAVIVGVAFLGGALLRRKGRGEFAGLN